MNSLRFRDERIAFALCWVLIAALAIGVVAWAVFGWRPMA